MLSTTPPKRASMLRREMGSEIMEAPALDLGRISLPVRGLLDRMGQARGAPVHSCRQDRVYGADGAALTPDDCPRLALMTCIKRSSQQAFRICISAADFRRR